MIIVIDTNVIVSALMSSSGASFALVSALPSVKFTPAISVPLWQEYKDVTSRPGLIPHSVSQRAREGMCRFVLSVSREQDIYFLWRDGLRDPKDAHVLELTIAAQARYIVTHNIKDFAAAKMFGIAAVRPNTFIQLIGGLQ
jgi:putative PIN family toxin of toxin-antitoxin system